MGKEEHDEAGGGVHCRGDGAGGEADGACGGDHFGGQGDGAGEARGDGGSGDQGDEEPGCNGDAAEFGAVRGGLCGLLMAVNYNARLTTERQAITEKMSWTTPLQHVNRPGRLP